MFSPASTSEVLPGSPSHPSQVGAYSTVGQRPSGVPEGTPDGRCPTVLYAPTWEGWDGDPGNTSLVLAGENIVKRLVKADPPVRVLYKAHPFTGTVSKEAGAA